MPIFRRRFDQDYFDSWAYRSHPNSRRNRMRLNLILDNKAGGRLLDIGIGRGDLLHLAASKFDVAAIDVSPHAASRLPPELRERITIGDIETIILPRQAYDVVTAFNILEHLQRPSKVVRNIYDSLAPNGIFVGSVPSNTGWIGSAHTAMTNFFDKTHRSCYKVDAWRRAFDKAGLHNSRFFGEIMLDGVVCVYVHSPIWRHIALNLMFLARKA